MAAEETLPFSRWTVSRPIINCRTARIPTTSVLTIYVPNDVALAVTDGDLTRGNARAVIIAVDG
jgi:hypothetical protein